MPEQFTWPGWGNQGWNTPNDQSIPEQRIEEAGSITGERGRGFGGFQPAPTGGYQRTGPWSDTAFSRAASRQRMMMPTLMSMFPQNTALSVSDVPSVQTELALQTWLQNVMRERPQALAHLGQRPKAYGMAQGAAQQLMDPAARGATFDRLATALKGQGAGAAGVAQAQLAAQAANRGIGGNLADYQRAILGQSQRQTLAGQLADLRAQQQQMQDQAYGTGAGILGGLSEMDVAAREALARLAIEQPITMPDLSALMVRPPIGGEHDPLRRSMPAGVSV